MKNKKNLGKRFCAIALVIGLCVLCWHFFGKSNNYVSDLEVATDKAGAAGNYVKLKEVTSGIYKIYPYTVKNGIYDGNAGWCLKKGGTLRGYGWTKYTKWTKLKENHEISGSYTNSDGKTVPEWLIYNLMRTGEKVTTAEKEYYKDRLGVSDYTYDSVFAAEQKILWYYTNGIALDTSDKVVNAIMTNAKSKLQNYKHENEVDGAITITSNDNDGKKSSYDEKTKTICLGDYTIKNPNKLDLRVSVKYQIDDDVGSNDWEELSNYSFYDSEDKEISLAKLKSYDGSFKIKFKATVKSKVKVRITIGYYETSAAYWTTTTEGLDDEVNQPILYLSRGYNLEAAALEYECESEPLVYNLKVAKKASNDGTSTGDVTKAIADATIKIEEKHAGSETAVKKTITTVAGKSVGYNNILLEEEKKNDVYTITETDAPEGYVCNNNKLVLTVEKTTNSEGTVTIKDVKVQVYDKESNTKIDETTLTSSITTYDANGFEVKLIGLNICIVCEDSPEVSYRVKVIKKSANDNTVIDGGRFNVYVYDSRYLYSNFQSKLDTVDTVESEQSTDIIETGVDNHFYIFVKELEAPDGFENKLGDDYAFVPCTMDEKGKLSIDYSFTATEVQNGKLNCQKASDNYIVKNEYVKTDEMEVVTAEDGVQEIQFVISDPQEIYDLSLRKFITEVTDTTTNTTEEVTTRAPQVDLTDLASGNSTTATYTHTKDPVLVHTSDIVTYTIRVYNEGPQNAKATKIMDDIPEGLEFLPDNETNIANNWKMYKEDGDYTPYKLESSEDADNTIEYNGKWYVQTDNASEADLIMTDAIADEVIKAYDSTSMTELDYRDIKVAFKVTEPTTSDRIVINSAQISEETDEDGNAVTDRDSIPNVWNDGEDDQDIEKVKVQYFDLALRKWVTQAIVTKDGQTTVTETGHHAEDNPEDVVKVDLKKSKLNEVTVKFRYSIRIINEGEIAGEATEISDYIPQGLKFVAEDNPDWKEVDGKVTTDKLAGTTLQPGESAEVEILLTWVNSESNMGVMTNTAEISKDHNAYGTPDIDSTPNNLVTGEDDIDDAPVMLTIKTGSTIVMYVSIGMMIMVVVGSSLVGIRRYFSKDRFRVVR